MSTITAHAESNLISHSDTMPHYDLAEHQERLKASQNLVLPLEQELSLLEQINEFELGRFLLLNKGLNGYWTSYIILHGPQKQQLHPLEHWLLHHAPAVVATQQRFALFKKHLQQQMKSGMTLASVPCGLMDDLLGLDYSDHYDIKLVGIDLDENSLKLAQENVQKHQNMAVSLIKKNAWDLEIDEQYDILTSNGLNIYEPDDKKVVALYKQFFKALKPQGILITSFLTPPPVLAPNSTWKNYDPAAALKQKAVFVDILQVAWQSFRTEEQTREQLMEAGFTDIDIIYDKQGMFPTVIARK